MYSKFKFENLLIKNIDLDVRNPRIVTQKKISSQNKIVGYLFEHEGLAEFIKKIMTEGRNPGAERPYVVKEGKRYTVIEGNTRIASYKLLTGMIKPPTDYADCVPQIPDQLKSSLTNVDCSVAPSRDALLPIMANAHFGLGDKSKWGYLGSRKAVYDEWKAGKSVASLAKAFDRTKGQINDLILEYMLYLKALSFKWTKKERDILLNPAVEFNPPVRFLQTSGHKAKTGISYDKANLEVLFETDEAEKKYQHLVRKLVVNPETGIGATASYDQVFESFGKKTKSQTSSKAGSSKKSGSSSGSGKGASTGTKLKIGALFAYPATVNDLLLTQLMKEAKDVNANKLPAAATFLLRNIVESILKHIIDVQKANKQGKLLDLEKALSLCQSKAVTLPPGDKKILKEFQKSHLNYLNLGSHGSVVPNAQRVLAARDCIDQFVKRNV